MPSSSVTAVTHFRWPDMVAGEVRTGSVVIDGLKLTMTGMQLQSNLAERIRWHQTEMDRMAEQLQAHRSLVDAPYADRLLEDEIGRVRRRIDVLTFIQDYIVADEVYRLGEFDLRFADLLPDEDGWDGEPFGIRRAPPALRT
jgi:hypothetical protein